MEIKEKKDLVKEIFQEINQAITIAQNKGLETVIDCYARRAGVYLS